MRILQIIRSLDLKGGGPVEGVVQQNIALIAAGHIVRTVTLDEPTAQYDTRLRHSDIYFLGPALGKYGFAPLLSPWLDRYAKDFDILIVNGIWQYHSFATMRAARKLKLPYVVFPHGMLDPWFKKANPLKHFKKLLYWVVAEYWVISSANLVLFTTSEELTLARQPFWPYKARELQVGYGIKARDRDANAEEFYRNYPNLRGKKIMLFLSRIHTKKGCDLLIEAFASLTSKHPDVHLVVAGPDSIGWSAKLKKMSVAFGISDRVLFPGMLVGESKWSAYDAADVFILPSHQENFGVVIAEALASRVPVLTTFKVNIWREIVESRAGFVADDDLEGVKLLMNKWFDIDTHAQSAMRVNALECFENNFEISALARRLVDALHAVSGQPKRQHSYRSRFID